MVELLNNFPSYVVAYRARGKVNREEYERVVMNRVDEVAQQFDAINFIVKLETGMQNYSIATLIDYLKISFRHIKKWNRMAIVSDQTTVRKFYDALSPLVPGKIIGYELKDFDKAKAWVSEPFLVDENLFLNWKKGLAAGAVATSAMTAFSLIASKFKKRNFSEPDLLAKLFQGWNPKLKKPIAKAMGWNAHYAVGSGWALLYGILKNEKDPLLSPLLFGIFSGTTGIFIWKKAFDLNPNPPQIDRKKFYAQLFLAHIVFSFSLHQSYKQLNKR